MSPPILEPCVDTSRHLIWAAYLGLKIKEKIKKKICKDKFLDVLPISEEHFASFLKREITSFRSGEGGGLGW